MTAVARKLRKQDSWGERLMWSWLRGRRFATYKFRRQMPLGPHVLDFFCAEAALNIEVDGFQHGRPDHADADTRRDEWLDRRGIKVLRFWNTRLRRDKEAIRDAIWHALQKRSMRARPEYCKATEPLEARTITGGDE